MTPETGDHEQLRSGEISHELPSGYIHWNERLTNYKNDHKYLSTLSLEDWFFLYENPERSFSLISEVLLEEEYARYNPGEEWIPETKIQFIIADNLKDATNLDGITRVRKKEARWAKASEHDELVAILSQFIENYPGTPENKVYSEIADVFLNLIHLTKTDSEFKSGYEQLIRQFAAAAGLSLGQVGILVITKYSTRLYRHQGQTNHTIEDAQIEQLLFGVPDDSGNLIKLLPNLENERASLIFDVMQKAVKPTLNARLKQMKATITLDSIIANNTTPATTST